MGRVFSCSHSSPAMMCWAERLLGFETRLGLGKRSGLVWSWGLWRSLIVYGLCLVGRWLWVEF